MEMNERLIVADDQTDWDGAKRRHVYDGLSKLGVIIKIDMALMNTEWGGHDRNSAGQPLATSVATIAREEAWGRGMKVFWDAKLKGNPNAIAKAVQGIDKMGVWGFTFHADMEDLRPAVDYRQHTLAIGVTILTSWSGAWCQRLYMRPRKEMATHFARRLKKVSASGFVCPAKALPRIAQAGLQENMLVIVPGARLANEPSHDHAKSASVSFAIQNGATHLVVGRTIMEAPDPIDAAKRYIDEMENAAANRSVL